MSGYHFQDKNPLNREKAVKMLIDHVPISRIAEETGMCRQTVAAIRDTMLDNGYDVTAGKKSVDYLDMVLEWDEVAFKALKNLKRWEEKKGRKPNLLWHQHGVKIT